MQSTSSLEAAVENAFAPGSTNTAAETRAIVDDLIGDLEAGRVRAAEPDDDGWRVNVWVKRGILLAFRCGQIETLPAAGPMQFCDKDTLPPQGLPKGVRVVPGGTALRAGAHLAAGVVVMPPAYVNVGAFVGAGSMIDSHALVGSCAQIGERVHLSAAAQVGGVLEPVGELPVIIEDDVLVGGNCGLYEGVLVRSRAVIASGVILTRSTPIFDCIRECVHRPDPNGVLEVPRDAVVVMGSRPSRGAFAESSGLQISTPMIIKYRDSSTDARTALEAALR